jgi:hypothetical protein
MLGYWEGCGEERTGEDEGAGGKGGKVYEIAFLESMDTALETRREP